MRSAQAAAGVPPWAVAALVLNALLWGLSWWPLRALQDQGLHPLWATAIVHGGAAGLILLRHPGALARLLRRPTLLLLALAAGLTNASFNWAVSIGDVLRVVLLFYLMPLWAVGLAWAVLGERPSAAALLRVALALAGAGLVLLPEQGLGGLAAGLDLGLADGLGLLGGLGFALTNVLLRRAAAEPGEARGLAMFVGGCGVAGLLAAGLGLQGSLPLPPAPWPLPGWLPMAVLLGAGFMLANLALQYGAARLPVNVAAVVMLSEVPFAALSATAFGEQQFTPRLLAGGALILGAAALAAWRPDRDRGPGPAPGA